MGEGIEFQGREAFGHCLLGLARVVLGRVTSAGEPVVRVELHFLPVEAAEKIVNRHSRRLAFDVPEGDIHRADGRKERARLAEPVHVAIDLGPEIIESARILADDEIADMFAGCFDEG